MPGPRKSPFPTGNPSRVWDTLVLALKNDPVLKGAVDTWQVFDGSEEDLLEPTGDDLPLIRLEPAAGQGMWLDNQAHQFTIPIKFTLAVQGTDIRVLWDFWDSVRAALFTGNTVLNALTPFGVIQKTMSAPVAEGSRFGEASGLSGLGVLTIKMRVDS